MPQVVATGTLNTHSMRSDIQGLKHFRHDSNRYLDETIRSRRICFGKNVLNGMRTVVLLPMKSQFSNFFHLLDDFRQDRTFGYTCCWCGKNTSRKTKNQAVT